MVKVKTVEGLELVIEKEFPCIINFLRNIETEISTDSENKLTKKYFTTEGNSVLFTSKPLDLEIFKDINVLEQYDQINVLHKEKDLWNALNKESIDFTAYNLGQ